MIFMPFVAYAYLSSAVYRTSAVVRVKPAPGANVQALPPLEASRRLRDAVLDQELIDRLSHDNSPTSVAEAQHLREQFELDSIDGVQFTLSFRAPDAARARSITNQLARRAVQAAPQALTSSVDRESEQRIDDLLGFLASRSAAPAGSPAPSVAPMSSAQAREETQRAALRAERQRLSDRLQKESSTGSDNPYADTSQPSPEIMKRRIAEIDRMLATARKPSAAAGAGAPEQDERWKQLVQAVLETGADKANTNARALTAELVQEAPLPTTPIEPNRKWVLFTGFLISLGAAGIVIVARSTGRGASRKSGRSSTQRTSKLDDTRRAPHARSQIPMPDRNLGNVTQQITHAATVPVAASAAPAEAPAAPDRVVIVPAGIIEIGDRSAPATARVVQAEVLPAPTSHTAKSTPPPAGVANPPTEAQRQARARGRVTQVLGSPILATPPARSETASVGTQGSEPPRAAHSEPARAPEVGSDPPRQMPRSDPPPQQPNDARQGAGSTSSAPPRSGARIQALDVSQTFRPDPSLTPAARRAVRDDLLPYLRQPGYVVAVLGTEDSAEAKARVAAELSLALASSEQFRLLLLECDLAAPRLEQLLHLPVPLSAGFSLQLQTRSRESSDYVWSVLRCSRSLDVLAEGAIRAPEAVYSPEFAACVNAVRFHYDVVVLNGPLLSDSDACRALDAVTDGVVTVTRHDHATLVREMNHVFSPKPFWRVEAG
jgi:Mrp family chromosome partitioning ATPase